MEAGFHLKVKNKKVTVLRMCKVRNNVVIVNVEIISQL